MNNKKNFNTGMENITKIVLFKNKQVRKTLHNDEWWFVINDIIEVLTDSNDPAQYFKRLKERDEELSKLTDKGGVQFVPPLMLLVETIGGVQKYWNDLKRKLMQKVSELSEKIGQLKMVASYEIELSIFCRRLKLLLSDGKK